MTGREQAYLLGLRLGGKKVIVIGGGAVATRRVPRCWPPGPTSLLVSPEATPGLEDLAASGRIDWLARAYKPGDCAGAWLVCACAGAPEVNEQVAQEADAQRIWCVRADDAAGLVRLDPGLRRAAGVQVGVLSGDPRRSASDPGRDHERG